jgi:hypothetical protein
MNPGKVAIINTPKQYATHKARLLPSESSADLPSAVRTAVSDFDQTLDKDTTILLETLNDKLAENRDNIIYDHDVRSPYWRTVDNAYWARFIQLKPKADRIVAAMRAYLKVR